MTPTFSTMINFSLKGIMEKIHKLQHISASESDDNIIFPRVKRRLLHLKEESNETFAVPNVDLITDEISKAKVDAIEVCKSCDMVLNSYEDKDLVQNVEKVVEEAIQHDHESNEGSIIENDDSSGPSEAMTQEDIVTINEDLSIIKLRKKASSVGLPTYQVIDKDEVCSSGKNYSLSGKTKDKKKSKKSSTETQTKSVSPFVLYQGSYIRKSTALYLLQENCQVSRERQYSSNFVDLSKESYKSIGVYANWFQGTRTLNNQDANEVSFKPVDLVFTPGYLPMSHYVASIDD